MAPQHTLVPAWRSAAHVRFADLAAVYVVGALDPAETAEFEAHLGTCTSCEREVSRLRDLTVVFARAVAAAGSDHLGQQLVGRATAPLR